MRTNGPIDTTFFTIDYVTKFSEFCQKFSPSAQRRSHTCVTFQLDSHFLIFIICFLRRTHKQRIVYDAGSNNAARSEDVILQFHLNQKRFMLDWLLQTRLLF
jgi:hypothetical protein